MLMLLLLVNRLITRGRPRKAYKHARLDARAKTYSGTCRSLNPSLIKRLGTVSMRSSQSHHASVSATKTNAQLLTCQRRWLEPLSRRRTARAISSLNALDSIITMAREQGKPHSGGLYLIQGVMASNLPPTSPDQGHAIS